jgi:hypothetical protein
MTPSRLPAFPVNITCSTEYYVGGNERFFFIVCREGGKTGRSRFRLKSLSGRV